MRGNESLHDPVEAYVDNGWMRARGTSLGADNGIGLSMALAVLESDTIEHPALEVMTTTNEEDGMSGAAQLSKDFLRGRKVINLDSEDYDTITTGAAGACLQFHRLPMKPEPAPTGKYRWYHIRFEGGLGGHSGVDINKGRCSAVPYRSPTAQRSRQKRLVYSLRGCRCVTERGRVSRHQRSCRP